MVSSNPPKTKIFVGRLPENCSNDELRQLFSPFGDVIECVVMNRYGFVHMVREEDAVTAIKALHNSNFKGVTINVEHSTGKSRGGVAGRRDDRRGGSIRGGRGGRDGGRDSRPGPYNSRRVLSGQMAGGYDGSTGGGVSTGYSDYNRGGGDFAGRGGDFGGRGGDFSGRGAEFGGRGTDFGGRGTDFSGGYADRSGYGQQNMGGGASMGYSSNTSIGGSYGPTSGAVGGYGPSGTTDYGRATDYSRSADFNRTDYGNRGMTGNNMGGDFNRGAPGPVDYGRTDNFGTSRAVDYTPRNDYDRGVGGPMRNGGGAVASSGYGTGYSDVPYEETNWSMNTGPSYNTGAPNYTTGPGPQNDMFSRRPGNAVPSSGYAPVGGGYAEAYDRPDPYGPPRGGRFPGPADAIPPRY